MANKLTEIGVEELRAMFDYSAETGVLTWKVRPNQSVLRGREAGNKGNRGYRNIKIRGRLHVAHRIAWAIAHGEHVPAGMQIDHVNGVKDDNRLSNLRLATHRENHQNRARNKNNKSGFLGVSPINGKWRAQIMADGKKLALGCFDAPEAARDAYLAAKAELHKFCQTARATA